MSAASPLINRAGSTGSSAAGISVSASGSWPCSLGWLLSRCAIPPMKRRKKQRKGKKKKKKKKKEKKERKKERKKEKVKKKKKN